MKRTDIKKVLVIGSGPIVVGQAAEFDYAGTQACIALREEGYEVVLVNSNPATIMTDPQMADKVYMEPLTLEYVAKIVRYERPDAILPGLGGQTGLNLCVQLARKGVLDECQVEILGTPLESIERAEDRKLFKEMCQSIGEPVIPSFIANSVEDGLEAARNIGYPVVLRPAFTLGGTGGGFVYNEEECRDLMHVALALSPVSQVLVEKSVKGYKEIEFEVMRDSNDNVLDICGMENVDPVGVHTGDSIVVAPILTLSDHDFKMLESSAKKIIRELGIAGGCNVQFALNPVSSEYYLIEVNPRVSRSSALASKASGYPIARVTAKIAVGLTLDEIMLNGIPANFEPSLDYIVTKVPRFAFDKFADASNRLGTQMKATGEVMSIGRNFEESLLKAIRSLETGVCHIYHKKFNNWTNEDMLQYISESPDDRLYAIAQLFRNGVDVETIHKHTQITSYFLEKIEGIVAFEEKLKTESLEALQEAKRLGFSDKYIGMLWGMTQEDVYRMRKKENIYPSYIHVNSYPQDAHLPYLYSSYQEGAKASTLNSKLSTLNSQPSREGAEVSTLNSKLSTLNSQPSREGANAKAKVLVLGAGPIRIGQGVEFDYSTVHAVWSLQKAGYEAIIINNNPETVSTDYTTSDRLYFEPLTVEDVMNVIDREQPQGVIVSLGGQTAINLAEPISKLGVKIIGTDTQAIQNAEDRDCFKKIMDKIGIPQPESEAVTDIETGVRVAERISYPVLVRPSYVLGGRAMQIVSNEEALRHYLQTAVEIDADRPVLVDKYIMGKELEVDAICDGRDVYVPGIMEHVEKTGIHSGDSISVYPTFSVSQKVKDTIISYTVQLGLEIGIVGLYNIQFIVDPNEKVYVIEVNPRSSRTVPFISKSTNIPMAHIATRVMLGDSLRRQGIFEVYAREKKRWFVKAPAFSFAKIRGMESYLSPEMKSTGEAIGYDKSLTRALYKSLQSSGMKMATYGTIIVSLADSAKEEAVPLIRRFYNLGFNIEATHSTALYMIERGIKTRMLEKVGRGENDIIHSLHKGHVRYVINIIDINQHHDHLDGYEIRCAAIENNITTFTSLETVKVLLDVLEELTLGISTIDADD